MPLDGLSQAVLVISIDVDNRLHQPAWAPLVDRVARRLNRAALPATWAVSSLADDGVLESIADIHGRHEVALLGDPQWVGPEAGRTRFARQLATNLQLAAERHLQVTTLALRATRLTEHLDLLVKHRLSIVRPAIDTPRRSASPTPCSLRFGVWETPANCLLPSQPRWWTAGGWRVRWQIHQAIRRSDLIHLAIDLPQLVDRQPVMLAAIDRVVRQAQREQDHGRLIVQPLSWLAAHLTPQVRPGASCSVLRPAA